MLVLDDKNTILEYVLPDAFNLTGATDGGASVDLESTENGNLAEALDLAFGDGGRRLFVLDGSGLAEYVLGTFGMEIRDGRAPAVLSITRADPTDASTTRSALTFSVRFSEPVRNVGPANFVLNGTGVGTVTGVTAISGSQYNVTVRAFAVDGTLDLDVVPDGIADMAGNPLASPDPTGAEQQYLIINVPPVMESITRSNGAAQATADRHLAFDVLFSEPVDRRGPGRFPAGLKRCRQSPAVQADGNAVACHIACRQRIRYDRRPRPRGRGSGLRPREHHARTQGRSPGGHSFTRRDCTGVAAAL